MELTMLTCDNCQGKVYAGGVEPTRGRTRAELLEEVQRKKRVFEICRHCGRRSQLRVVPLVEQLEAKYRGRLTSPPPEAHLRHR